jgi:hypothetical protein
LGVRKHTYDVILIGEIAFLPELKAFGITAFFGNGPGEIGGVEINIGVFHFAFFRLGIGAVLQSARDPPS